MIQYVILAAKDFSEDLDYYCKPEGRLGCHPDYVPGIEVSTGSLAMV